MSESVFRRMQRPSAPPAAPEQPPKKAELPPEEAVRAPQPDPNPAGAPAVATAAPAPLRAQPAPRFDGKKQTIYPKPDFHERVGRFASKDADMGRRYSKADVYERLALLGEALLRRLHIETVPLESEIGELVSSITVEHRL